MGSENPSGADNQQETAVPCLVLDPNWIAGFVDGEGCFSVSVHRNSMMRRHGGWQLQTVFHIYQHQDHREVLEAMVPAFGCGRVRPKGPRSSVLTFAVEGLRDLETAVLPFFEKHPLVVKYHDFAAFSAIVRSMRRKEHLTAVWVRASGACCLWDECPWKAALQKQGNKYWQDPQRLHAGLPVRIRFSSHWRRANRGRRYSPTPMATWGAEAEMIQPLMRQMK